MALFLCIRIDNYTHFSIFIFFTFGPIPPSTFKLLKATIYQIKANVIRILQKFAIAALEHELQPRKPVHFYFYHSLIVTIEKP